MEFQRYRRTQEINLGWRSRPTFGPSQELLSWIPDGPAQRALDLGCSTGGATMELATKGYQAVGLDLFPSLVRHAPPVASYAVGDMHDLPFADGSFDVVLADNGYEHAHDPVRAMQETARVLKRPGSLYAMLPLHAKSLSPAHLWQAATIRDLFDVLFGWLPLKDRRPPRVVIMRVPPEEQVLFLYQWRAFT